jgi:hypothetical protein
LTRNLLALGVVLWGIAQAAAQAPSQAAQAPAEATQTPATPAALKCNNCLPIQATATVNADVSVEAGLMPPLNAQKVFGKEIGQAYGVFLLTISNHSADASLIVQSVFIDYSTWSLAGCGTVTNLPDPVLGSYQASSKPCQSASAEQGALRALLQYGQTWSWRNQLIRYLTAAGAIASGVVWRAGPTANGPKYISTITGTAIPAIGVAIPDDFIGRLNLLNDSGFRVNTVVPKQSAAVVVAFFPLDKFFTPTLKKYFLQNPSLFFSPNLLLTEDASRKDLLNVLKRVLTLDEFNALAMSADGSNKTLRVDWSRFADPYAAAKSCTQVIQAANPDAAKQAADAAATLKAVADAAAAAEKAVADAKALLDAAQLDATAAGRNLAATQELVTAAEARISDLMNAASHAAGTAANQAEIASGSSRQSAEFAAQAKGFADAASTALSEIRAALLDGAHPVAVPQPVPADLTGAVSKAQDSERSAAMSDADAHKTAADAAQSAAEAQASVIKVEHLFQEFQQAVTAAAGAAAASLPANKLSIQSSCLLQDVLNRLTLNTIRAVVGGEMSVDVDSVPGAIQGATFDGTDPAAIFAVAGDKTGTLSGLYLSGAQVQVANVTGAKVATVSDGSTATSLKFKLTLTSPIPSGTVIHFTVTKAKKDGTTLTSGEYLYTVNYTVSPPRIDDVKATTDDTGTTTVTVTGSNFYDFNLKYTLTSNSTGEVRTYPETGKTAVAFGKLTPQSFELVFKSTDLDPGRWLIHLTSDQFKGSDFAAPAAKTFQISITPTLTSAKVDSTGKQITISGTGFYNLANEAAMKLVFKILKTDKTTTDAKATIQSTSTALLALTAAASAGSDQVEVFIGTGDKPAAGPIAIAK